MSFDKFYAHRKDHRRQYYGSKAFDATCRSHGSCGCCAELRKYKVKRRTPIEDEGDDGLMLTTDITKATH